MNTTAPPSLLAGHLAAQMAPMAGEARQGVNASLLDLLYDGLVMLFLLKNNNTPAQAEAFFQEVRRYLDEFERGARKNAGTSAEEIYAAKYAFCATVDEFILSNPQTSIHAEWERRPLQLTLFGEQLAGENFFKLLEEQRAQGAPRLQAMEVFYMCLLLGFKGKYLLEGPEKLAYLTGRLGDEIAAIKGQRATFAPRWQLPDLISHTLKREAPQWVVAAVFALIGLATFAGLSQHLGTTSRDTLAAYQDVIQLGPRQANLTISLP